MTRLANQNLSDVEPSPLIEFLFYNHPAIGKRLRHADEFAIRTPTTGRKRQIGAIMKDEQ
jgi:Zn-dependent protease with chaperone function